MTKSNRLEGKVAIVTGAGTGIGRAIAQRFHEEGAFVALFGRRVQKLNDMCQLLSPDGERVLAVVGDITVEDDVRRLVDETAHVAGKIDIVVNNAGVMRFGSLEEAPVASWDLMMKTNAWGPWRLMAHALPVMRQGGGGSIVNLSSLAGIKAFPNSGLYCASKAALQTLSQVMAMETARANVRVNCILPALVEETELADPIMGTANIPAFWDRFRPLHPLGRNGRPKDIADAALFFASDESAWITGTLLSIDGGRHMATNRPVV